MTHLSEKAIEAGARAQIVSDMQQAIMKNPLFNGNSVSAFGMANAAFDAYQAALAADGMCLVPKEPTPDRIEAIEKCLSDAVLADTPYTFPANGAELLYRAMIAASQAGEER